MTQQYAKQRRYSARKSLLSSDIHPIPGVVDPARKEECKGSLKLFLETYCREAFPLPWADFHLEVIHGVETAIANGQSQAIGLPRGSGKTTIIVRAALWALLYGHSPYVMIVAADAAKAKKQLKTIKSLLRMSELLFEDFPEVCHPVRQLQGQAINAQKQHCDGEFTLMDWRDSVAQLPTLARSASSGSVVEVAGVTAASRGAQTTLPDGSVIRPTLILVDDFQTRESARSELQCNDRLATIAGDLAGMRGPEQPLAMLAALTVIERGDGADRLLDDSLYPEWRGIRHRMVENWPTAVKLWEEYSQLRLDAIRDKKRPEAAEAFYVTNRKAMDKGSKVSWEHRRGEDLSAIQHAQHLFLRCGEAAFNAEYQNEPDSRDDTDFGFLGPAETAAKVNGLPKGRLPSTTTVVTAAIDVQSNHLWWACVGWEPSFGGTILDYGPWPHAGRNSVTKRNIPKHFGNTAPYKGLGEEASITLALETLIEDLMGRTWKVDDGTQFSIGRVLVDEGYQTDTVHAALRGIGRYAEISPAKGWGIKATSKRMAEWPRKKGEPKPTHPNWRHRVTRNTGRSLRTTAWDAYYWRTLVHRKLATGKGDPGSLNLWGKSKSRHSMFASHLDSHTPKLGQGDGSVEVIEWTHRPNKPDEDLLDCMCMAAVAASQLGVRVEGGKRTAPRSTGDKAKSEGLTLAEYVTKTRKS